MVTRIPVQAKAGYTVRDTIGLPAIVGDIGLEIEMEGNKFPKTVAELPKNKVWVYHADHSLRGADNAEYVYRVPRAFDKVEEDVKSLFSCLEGYGTILDDSNRTSVHVHLNVLGFHANRIAAFSALCFSLEELLAEYCGEHRVGNLFCLRGKDAPAIVSRLKTFIKRDMDAPLSDNLHYAGFNAAAIFKFGSIEIRTMRGATEPDQVVKWVKILRRLYEYSAEFTDPRDVCNLFSYGGPDNYLATVLGDTLPILFEGIDWHNEKIRQSLYEGIRLAQDICFVRDWSLFEAKDRRDPFGRVATTSPQLSTYSFNTTGILQQLGSSTSSQTSYLNEPDDDDEEYEHEIAAEFDEVDEG